MKLIFTGKYTGGRTSITIDGVTFEGREPSDVPAGSRLLGHPEFERAGDVTEVEPVVVDFEFEGDDLPVPEVKRRGRPKKETT